MQGNGAKPEKLANDISSNGLINPITITPDHELIAGERRLQACKSLGMKEVEVHIIAIKDAEQKFELEIAENETRKDFSKSERIDCAREFERIESLKAKERMSNDGKGCLNSDNLRTDEIVAKKLNYRRERHIPQRKIHL